jgi:hypothetical protein
LRHLLDQHRSPRPPDPNYYHLPTAAVGMDYPAAVILSELGTFKDNLMGWQDETAG